MIRSSCAQPCSDTATIAATAVAIATGTPAGKPWGFYVMKHDPNKAMIINPRKIYRCGIENSGK
jgi:hypothetical protein